MRILFTCTESGLGHLLPLLPIARAARRAGHAVVFACEPAMLPAVTAAGFYALAAGTNPRDIPEHVALRRQFLAHPTPAMADRLSLLGWAGCIARYKATALLALLADLRPDLLVVEEMDFGSMLAAERCAIPYASVQIMAPGFVRHDDIAGPLNDLRAAHGLPPDPDLAFLSRFLVLSPFPPRYHDPAVAMPATVQAIRPVSAEDADGGGLPPGIARERGVPIIHFTLGTAFSSDFRSFFPPVIAAVQALPITLVVTVGWELDPAQFGPRPANVHIARFIPHGQLLRHCALVVSHAGSGTVMATLAHGLPMVLLPLAADHPLHAARCTALGVARQIIVPEMAREAVETVLADPTYRVNAERLRDEIAALPGPEEVVRLLERLAAEQQPITGDGSVVAA